MPSFIPGRVRSILIGHRSLFFAITTLTAYAWTNRFFVDDAYISGRYAENLAAGHGLVWNLGERVEGYTNFLWTIMLAAGLRVGADLVVLAQGLGLLAFAGTLAAAYALARRITDSSSIALLTVALLGLNSSFSAFATGGLETQLQAFCITMMIMTLVNSHPPRWQAVSLGALMAVSLLVRLDSAVIIVSLAFCVSFLRRRECHESLSRNFGRALLLCTALIAPWLIWKLLYYGSVLPNTFQAKVGGFWNNTDGLSYVLLFLCANLLIFHLIWIYLRIVVLRKWRPKEWNSGFVYVTLPWATWFIYITSIGGNTMEFRFIVPVLPLLYISIIEALCYTAPKLARFSAYVVMFGGCLLATVTIGRTEWISGGTESIARLRGHLDKPSENWRGIGLALGAAFATDRTVRIATTAAGAIPYYSRLPATDMHGLTDPVVARTGVQVSARPGHQKLASLGYLAARGVHLVIGHPRLLRVDSPGDRRDRMTSFGPVRADERPVNPVGILEVPVGNGYVLPVLYLTPHPTVEVRRRELGWSLLTVEGADEDEPSGGEAR